jgi:hypothetical protein
MQLGNVKSVVIGVVAAVAAMAITGAASGSGVGAVFNLGKANTVNGPSSLTGSTRHPMLSVTNSGAGAALSLQVRPGKAPFSVNSSGQVARLNASLLGGLAASSFLQGGGQSRSFGFVMEHPSVNQRPLLHVPGFGTLTATCGPDEGGSAAVTLMTGAHAMDEFDADLRPTAPIGVGNAALAPNTSTQLVGVIAFTIASAWDRVILRYTTGSGSSLTTHMAMLDIMLDVNSTCDFDATAVTSITPP